MFKSAVKSYVVLNHKSFKNYIPFRKQIIYYPLDKGGVRFSNMMSNILLFLVASLVACNQPFYALHTTTTHTKDNYFLIYFFTRIDSVWWKHDMLFSPQESRQYLTFLLTSKITS